MGFDSSANLLFSIAADTSDAEGNIERFRGLLSQSLGDMGTQFHDWATQVFGDVSTVTGALTAMTAAGAAGLVALAGAAAAAGEELWSLGEKAAAYAEKIEQGSIKTGLTAKQMSGLAYAAKNVNLGYDEMVQCLVRFERSIAEAQDSTSKQAQAFARLGITQDQVKVGAVNMLPLLNATATAFKEHANGTMKAAVSMDLMGRSGTKVIEFFNQGAAGFEALAEQADKLGLLLSEKDVEAAKAFRTQMVQLNGAVEGIKIQIGKELLPTMTEAAVRFEAWALSMMQLNDLLHKSKSGWESLHILLSQSNWDEIFKKNLDSAKKSLEEFAKAAAVAGDAPVIGGGGKAVKEATENFTGLSRILEELALKTAAAEGPEERLAAEMAHMREEVDKAGIALVNLQNAGKLDPGTIEREVAAWEKLSAAIEKYGAAAGKKLADAREEAFEEAFDKWNEAIDRETETLVEKTAQQHTRTYAEDVAAWNAEIVRMRQKMEEKKTNTAENEAALNKLQQAGLDKRAKTQEQAFQQELSRLDIDLDKQRSANQTAETRLAAIYAEDLEKYSRAEEAKALATATSLEQILAIEIKFYQLRAGAAQIFNEGMQQLKNSDGWQSVFGSKFGEMIKRNEDLTKQWATSTNQSLMMVKVSLEGMKEMSQDAFQSFAEGMGSAIAEAIVYQKSIGEAMRAALASTLESLSARAISYAIFSVALGLLDLAEQDYEGAANAFAAAEMFGVMGVASGLLGRAIAPKQTSSSGGAGGASTGSVGGSVGMPGGASGWAGGGTGGQNRGGTHVTINVAGHVIGPYGAQQLCNMITDAVVNSNATLTASNTTSGRQIRQ